MIPTDGIKWKLEWIVDSVPPDKACEVLDGEVNYNEWGKNDDENVADINETHNLVKFGSHYAMLYW